MNTSIQYAALSVGIIVVLGFLYLVFDKHYTRAQLAQHRIECNTFATGNSYVQYMDKDGGVGDKVINENGALSYETLYRSCMRSKGVRADQF